MKKFVNIIKFFNPIKLFTTNWVSKCKVSCWGLKAKLFGFAAIPIAIIIIVGMVSNFAQKKIIKTYDKIMSEDVSLIQQLNEMNLKSRDILIVIGMMSSSGKSEQMISELTAKYDSAVDAFNAARKAVRARLEEKKQEKEIDGIQSAWKELSKVNDDLMALAYSKSEEDIKKTLEILNGPLYKARNTFSQAIDDVIKKENENITLIQNQASDEAKKMNFILFASISVSLLIALVVAWLIANNLSKKLNIIATQLSTGSVSVTQTSELLSSISTSLSSSSSEQASSMQETANTTDHVNAAVLQNAENAKASQKFAKEAKEQAEYGKEIVTSLVQKMSDISQSNKQISDQVAHSNKQMEGIVKVIKEIGTKTNVINDIVFQTRLLSFNASVEAARAGEHGKGFAVVAEEVGKLAAMSGEAAQEINNMLRESTVKVEEIISDSKSKAQRLLTEGGKKVEEGVASVMETEDVFQKISKNIAAVDTKMIEITSATSDESQKIQEINKAILQLEELAQENLKIVADSSVSASELSTNATDLKKLSDQLLETVLGVEQKSENYIDNDLVSQLINEQKKKPKVVRKRAA